MAYESFHDFIRALEKAGELTRIALPVATELEITELAERQMKSPDGGLSTLLNLPIQKCWPLDGGRFITLPCVVTKDPDTGERNVGMYRLQIYDERTLGMHWQLQKVGARHGRRYYETGARMPVAVFLGGDPVFTFGATAPLPDGLDEFLLAGYLRNKSVEIVKW